MQTFSVHKTKLSFKNSCMDTVFPDMLIILLFKREHLPACVLVPGTSAQRVGFFNIWSGRVLDKIPGSGSGRSVEKYDRVFPGIFFTFGYFGYFRVCRVFPGLPIYIRVFSTFNEAEKIATKPNSF